VEVLTGLARRVALLAALVVAAASAGAQPQATEPAVKAALLYKFASYVEWPPQAAGAPTAPFVFGVMGADDVAAELEQLVAGRTVNGRPAKVRRVREGESLGGLHVLFVGVRDTGRIRAVAGAARPASVLVVSDTSGGLEAGSVINFVPAEERVGFEVSVDAADRSALKVSSRMLGVARRVVSASSS